MMTGERGGAIGGTPRERCFRKTAGVEWRKNNRGRLPDEGRLVSEKHKAMDSARASRRLRCPLCRKEDVLRSRPQTTRERLAEFLFMSPFHCRQCSHRFLASRLGVDHPRHLVDRREHLRIPVRLFLSFSGGRVRGEGIVMDISMGGCIIRSETQVHPDDIFYLEIAIAVDQPPLHVAAMVRSVGPRGIAFKFLRAAQENKRLLAFVQAKTSAEADRIPADSVSPA